MIEQITQKPETLSTLQQSFTEQQQISKIKQKHNLKDNQNKKIYIDDTIETFLYQKQALQFKLQHNIAELSSKNSYLTTVLKQLALKQSITIQKQCSLYKQLIKTCIQLQDDLAGLDALEKKTQILKFQAQELEKYFQQ